MGGDGEGDDSDEVLEFCAHGFLSHEVFNSINRSETFKILAYKRIHFVQAPGCVLFEMYKFVCYVSSSIHGDRSSNSGDGAEKAAQERKRVRENPKSSQDSNS